MTLSRPQLEGINNDFLAAPAFRMNSFIPDGNYVSFETTKISIHFLVETCNLSHSTKEISLTTNFIFFRFSLKSHYKTLILAITLQYCDDVCLPFIRYPVLDMGPSKDKESVWGSPVALQYP